MSASIQVYAKALGHPTREAILREFAKGGNTPRRVGEIIDTNIGLVGYHTRQLYAMGAIKLVREVTVRGAIEHHYVITDLGRKAIRVADFIRVLR